MATQIVMDRTGDTRHYFDAMDPQALLKAEERFKELTYVGFTAAVRTSCGEAAVTRTFNPTAEETLLFSAARRRLTLHVQAASGHRERLPTWVPDARCASLASLT